MSIYLSILLFQFPPTHVEIHRRRRSSIVTVADRCRSIDRSSPVARPIAAGHQLPPVAIKTHKLTLIATKEDELIFSNDFVNSIV